MLSKNNIKNIYPLSPLQEGMFFHWQLDPRSASYHEQVSYRLAGDLDIPQVKRALGLLLERYDILRTVFIQKGTNPPLQVVLKEREGAFEYRDLSGRPDREETVRRFKREDRLQTFDLNKDVLMRVCVFRAGAHEFEFIWSYHHILMDGWCVGILVGDFLAIYRSLAEGETPRLRPVKQYLAYIDWLQKRDRSLSLEFWRQYLDGYDEAVGIPPSATSRRNNDDYDDNAVEVELEENLTSRLANVASERRATVNTILQTLWGVLLGKYSRREDVVFGVVVSGRPPQIDGVESMVGLFINTVPVRVRFDGSMTLGQLFSHVQTEALDSEPHHYTSLADIQVQSLLKQELIDHIFVFENFPLADLIDGAPGRAEAHDPAIRLADTEVFERSNYHFSVNAALVKGRLHIRLKFNENRFEAGFVHEMAGHLQALARQASENPDTAVRELEILSETQREKLIHRFNDTRYPFAVEKSIPELFRQAVAESPDAAAVAYEERLLTYRELDRRANGLAHALLEMGAGPGKAVALLLERGLVMAVAIMGTLKTGAAYVPVDPRYPDLRKRYVLEDCDAAAIIDNDSNFPSRDEAPDVTIDSSLPAYMIYTSGTTGRPKGAIVEHRNLHHLLVGLKRRIYDRYPAGRKVALLAPYVFDASVKQIFAALSLGHTLYIVPEDVRINGEKLIDYYRRHQIDISDGTPTHLRLMTESNGGEGPALPVRHFIIGGEALSRPVIERFFAGSNGASPVISNIYGVAECAVDTTCFCVERHRIPGSPIIPIGTPLANSRIYILDLYGHAQPFGIPGEICIAGSGVGRGYLKQEELTRQKFGEDPFVPGERMYRSGDVGLRLADGVIQFVGRIDRQVKIRGFRIETGEIEAQLREYSRLNEAVVVARNDAVNQQSILCAYYTSERELDPSSLREHLSVYLPSYMIPASFTRLDRIPVTPHGKVDEQALPDPRFPSGTGRLAPAGEVEERLLAIWAGVLGIPAESFGVEDNFFDLGGHSLRATILVSHIHKELEVKLPLADVFSNPTIRRLATAVKSRDPQRFITIPPAEKKDYYPLSSAQHRLYFMQRMDPTNNSYNMKNIFIIEGALDRTRLESVCRGLLDRHHSLRTAFVIAGKSPVQRALDHCSFEVDSFTGTENDVKGIVEGYIGPFDLAFPPLLRVGLVELAAERFVLMVVIHHIVSDGVSNDILIKDFWKLYNGEELTPLRIQYSDYAVWQETAEGWDMLVRQEAFWLKEFPGTSPVLNLPLDFQRPAKRSFDGASRQFSLQATLTSALIDLARKEEVTLYMLMLAIFNVLLAKWSGVNDIVVGTGVAGRPHADTQTIIGMFVNVLPVRNTPSGDKSFRSFLQEVKHKTLAVFENQDYPFDRLVDKVGGHKDLSRNPIYDAVFQLQNTTTQASGAGGPREAGLMFSHYGFENDSATFDLLFEVRQSGEGLDVRIEYCTRLFAPATIDAVFGYFERIASAVTADPGSIIRKIDMVTEEEKEKILAKLHVSDEPMSIDFNF